MNCNNNGGNCCSNGLPTIQQGDTFGIGFQYKEDNEPTALPEGYDLIVGIYSQMNQPLKVGKLSDNTIADNGGGSYTLSVSHAESMTMMGMVRMEITIADSERNVVDHASSTVMLSFEPRNNNDLL